MRIFNSLRDYMRKKKRQIQSKRRKVNKHLSSFFKRRETADSFTKRKVDLILNNAIIWIYLSYILAFTGKESIAENLSITVVKVIIYTFMSYSCKALFENVFKYGKFFIKGNPYIGDNDTVDENTSTNTEVTDSEEITEIVSDEEAAG